MRIRKAILPVAGKGSRVAPISNFIPKEMLPVSECPLIHYSITEAIDAGIDEFIIVTRPSKNLLVEYIEATFGQSRAKFFYVNQNEPTGLGSAILCASNLINDDDVFAVILPDDLILNVNCLSEMIDYYKTGNIVATESVLPQQTRHYGILNVSQDNENIVQANGVIEKPAIAPFNKNYAVAGRYLLQGSIMKFISSLKPGTGNEIQLSDALTNMAQAGTELFGFKFSGTKIDCGSKAGWIKGLVSIALQDEELFQVIKSCVKE